MPRFFADIKTRLTAIARLRDRQILPRCSSAPNTGATFEPERLWPVSASRSRAVNVPIKAQLVALPSAALSDVYMVVKRGTTSKRFPPSRAAVSKLHATTLGPVPGAHGRGKAWRGMVFSRNCSDASTAELQAVLEVDKGKTGGRWRGEGGGHQQLTARSTRSGVAEQ